MADFIETQINRAKKVDKHAIDSMSQYLSVMIFVFHWICNKINDF